jgi:hypothetical protein
MCIGAHFTTTGLFECVCEDGWTGRSDWINGEGFDCGVNIKVVQLLWGINLLVTMAYVVFSEPYLEERYQMYYQARENSKMRNEKMSMWTNRVTYALVFMFAIAIPCQLGMCLLRLLNTDVRVGLNVLPTALFSLTKFGLYTASWLFSPALLQAVLRGQQQTEWIVRYNDKYSAFTSVMSVIIGLLPFLNMVLTDEDGSQSHAITRITYSAVSLV